MVIHGFDASRTVTPPFTGGVQRTLGSKVFEGALLSVKDFGAVGNYTADDTAAIQAAIDAAETEPRQYAGIYLPGGVYRTTATLRISLGSMQVVGDGAAGVQTVGYPSSHSGTMIMGDFERDGSNPAVLLIQGTDPTKWIYRIDLRDFRVGMFGAKTSKPDGIVFNGVSEFTMYNIRAISGLASSFVLNACTIGYLEHLVTGGNVIGIEMLSSLTDLPAVQNTTGSIYIQNSNIWLNSAAAFSFDGVVGGINISDTFIEYAPTCLLFKPGAAGRTYSRFTLDRVRYDNSGGDAPANPRFLRATAGDDANALRLLNIVLRDCLSGIAAQDYMFEYVKGTNTSASSFMQDLSIINGSYTGQTLGLVYSDTGNTTCQVQGTTLSFNNSDVAVPFIAGNARLLLLKSTFGYWDMAAGSPLRLPQGLVVGFTDAGQLWFSPARNRVVFSDGTTQRMLPRRSTAANGDVAATLLTTSAETQIWNTELTADRVVTLSTTSRVDGDYFRIIRTAAATGAFALNVGTGPLAALDPAEWCDVEFNDTAWVLTAKGSLA